MMILIIYVISFSIQVPKFSFSPWVNLLEMKVVYVFVSAVNSHFELITRDLNAM